MLMKTVTALATAAALLVAAPTFAPASRADVVTTQMLTPASSGYVDVNGLHMYYQVHGVAHAGAAPIVLVHGAFMTIETWGALLEGLAKDRQVIAFEQQAHGRTKDIDRAYTFEQAADDMVAGMRALGIQQADVVGYSVGGVVALQMAIRHPEAVRRLVSISGASETAGQQPELAQFMPTLTPDAFAGSPWLEAYKNLGGTDETFAKLVRRVVEIGGTPFAWPDATVAAIRAPTFIVVGDSDSTTVEHATKLYRLLGGGAFGDLHGLPNAQLAILPATFHVRILDRAGWLVPMIEEFLERQPAATN